MKKLLLIVLLIVGCEETTEPEDCAGAAGGGAVNRLIGDIDGDGYITGYCCEQASCQNNPYHDINLCSENTAVGDIGAIIWLALLEDSHGLGCGESEGGWEEGEAAPYIENCPDFYGVDVNGDGGINNMDVDCLISYFTNGSSGCEIPVYVNNPCTGKHIGEECCISE